jgi:hypothetical protein
VLELISSAGLEMAGAYSCDIDLAATEPSSSGTG